MVNQLSPVSRTEHIYDRIHLKDCFSHDDFHHTYKRFSPIHFSSSDSFDARYNDNDLSSLHGRNISSLSNFNEKGQSFDGYTRFHGDDNIQGRHSMQQMQRRYSDDRNFPYPSSMHLSQPYDTPNSNLLELPSQSNKLYISDQGYDRDGKQHLFSGNRFSLVQDYSRTSNKDYSQSLFKNTPALLSSNSDRYFHGTTHYNRSIDHGGMKQSITINQHRSNFAKDKFRYFKPKPTQLSGRTSTNSKTRFRQRSNKSKKTNLVRLKVKNSGLKELAKKYKYAAAPSTLSKNSINELKTINKQSSPNKKSSQTETPKSNLSTVQVSSNDELLTSCAPTISNAVLSKEISGNSSTSVSSMNIDKTEINEESSTYSDICISVNKQEMISKSNTSSNIQNVSTSSETKKLDEKNFKETQGSTQSNKNSTEVVDHQKTINTSKESSVDVHEDGNKLDLNKIKECDLNKSEDSQHFVSKDDTPTYSDDDIKNVNADKDDAKLESGHMTLETNKSEPAAANNNSTVDNSTFDNLVSKPLDNLSTVKIKDPVTLPVTNNSAMSDLNKSEVEIIKDTVAAPANTPHADSTTGADAWSNNLDHEKPDLQQNLVSSSSTLNFTASPKTKRNTSVTYPSVQHSQNQSIKTYSSIATVPQKPFSPTSSILALTKPTQGKLTHQSSGINTGRYFSASLPIYGSASSSSKSVPIMSNSFKKGSNPYNLKTIKLQTEEERRAKRLDHLEKELEKLKKQQAEISLKKQKQESNVQVMKNPRK